MAFPSRNRDVIRWGIIGCGDVTEVKSGPGFAKANGSRLVAVMRRNGALAADYAKRHSVPRWFDDARKLVADPEVDAVYVATPPGAHLEGALLAAAAGKPCYVEKPMARHTAECDAMIAAFAATQTKLFVAYYRRAMPRFLKVKEILESGVLGQITGISYRMATPLPANSRPTYLNPPVANAAQETLRGGTSADDGVWRLDASRAGGGLFLDVGSHLLDYLDFCFGPLQDVRGIAARLASPTPVEDSVAMTFRTAAGVPGTASWNFASHAKEDTLEFFGTKGRVSLLFFGGEPIRLETGAGVETFAIVNPPHVEQPMIQTVVDELLGRGTCPGTPDSARRTQRVMDDVLAAYYGGRDDAFWTRPETWPGRR